VAGHWKQFENTIAESNAETLTATGFMRDIWKSGLAEGLERDKNPFDEAIERKWHQTWLFYGNSIRFTSAMAGGGDYGVFAGGRYQLSQTIAELGDWYRLHSQLKKNK
jgi:hydroxylamine dehydrogenase